MGLKVYIAASATLVAAGLGLAWYSFGMSTPAAAAGPLEPLSAIQTPDALFSSEIGDLPAPADSAPIGDLQGDALLSSGQYAKALTWVDGRIKAEGTTDALLLIRAQALAGLGRKPEAVAILDNVAAQNGDQAGDAAYEKALLLPAEEQLAALEAAWRKFPTQAGGMKAARDWADRRYAEVTASATGTDGYEAVRDAYSVVLYGRILTAAQEKPIVEKLNALNKFLLYSPASTMQSPTVTVHTVASGEALSTIARKYVVPVFRLQRINKIEDARRIRAGQKLRVITGASEVFADKSDFILTVFMDKKFIARYDIGIGKDDGTPEGQFKVVTKDWNPDWYYQGKRHPFGDPQNILGVAWLGLDAPSGSASIGIHGSPDGEGIGQKSSKGCIRLRNADVAEVYDWVTIGSPVTIAP